MRAFALRHPFLFSVATTLLLFGFACAGRAVYPQEPVGDIRQLRETAPSAFEEPSQLERAIEALGSPEGIYQVLTLAFAAALLSGLGWWGEAGFRRPRRWAGLLHLWLPLLAAGIALSGGFLPPEGAGELAALLIASGLSVAGEEMVFRGLLWRVLAPRGAVLAGVATSLLAGALSYAVSATGGPTPEARYIAAFTLCGGLAYAGLRRRTGSIWPPLAGHLAVSLATGVAVMGSAAYQILLYLGTLGFAAYGLALLLLPGGPPEEGVP
ncbi:CPBP family intramembrane glutamic endopeptidase [Burkholderia sp.]|uniref:CPBP family intramembrane glutamic endopeptidase n=1 Tax=Burkholderia sp. TaxID=36773 RepID=UPI002586E1D1|nr:CPBP family intramembrane glutamic endopeptidase [Burkholderia sp.]MCA3786149.1 CPBP family intramembrane metalloprotease [Burkholderia sp.]